MVGTIPAEEHPSPAAAADESAEAALHHATVLITGICRMVDCWHLLDEIEGDFHQRSLEAAIANHDTATLFDWLMEIFSFQGISDQVAAGYLRQNGSVRWSDIEAAFRSKPACPRLGSYWTFERCRYDKSSGSCSEPQHIDRCPLPRHRLRNGRLNQIAYSLFLFIRDVTKGDLVGWIDQQLGQQAKDSVDAAEHVIGPMRHIFGISDKVLAMAFASLFIGARRVKPRWFRIGVRLIAIDTLVHNFLHRSGILRRSGAEHPYGPRCYQDGGCAGIIRTVASRIDARLFNSAYPANFPRMVQFAIWRFCAADGLNVCNGNMINDTAACTNAACGLRQKCDHITLISQKAAKIERFPSKKSLAATMVS